MLFTVVKFVGAAYIVYLGIQAIRHRRRAATDVGVSLAVKSRWRLLCEGFFVGLSNPKSIVFFVAVLPQFVDYRAGAVPLQMATLGLVFLVLALLGDSVWALAAGSARDWFAKSPKRMEQLALGGGVMMHRPGRRAGRDGREVLTRRVGRRVGRSAAAQAATAADRGRGRGATRRTKSPSWR